MKNTWNIRKKEDAVSPVIATILMVAITVVLAAVLYVMVIGFGGTSDTAPSGSFQSLKTTSLDASTNTWNATITFSRFNPAPPMMDLRITLTNNSDAADVVTMTMVSAPTTTTQIMTVTGATYAAYVDPAFAGNEVNSGDSIVVRGLHRGTTYTISVFHIPSSEACTLAGGTTTLTTG